MAKIIMLLFSFFTLALTGLTSPRVVTSIEVTPSCQVLQTKQELGNLTVSRVFVSDHNLSVCANNDTTCCTPDMELRLHTLSQSNIRNIQIAKTDLIRKIFSKGVIKFRDYFEGRIDSSDRALDEKFTRRYRKVYANNSHVTKSFYNRLRKHYRNGESKISDIVDDFFKEVLKRMYLFTQGGTSEIDVNCIPLTYDSIQPFGVIPRRIIPRLERSITAARTLIHSLHLGKQVVTKLSDDIWFSNECWKSITKMSQCSLCAGYSNLRPCAGHCIDVFTQCFSALNEMEHVWDEYLSVLDDLSYKLTTEYDFDAVTGELPSDISQGIGNCQDSLGEIISKIDKFCNKGKKKQQTRAVIISNDDFFLERNGRVERSDYDSGKELRSTFSPFRLMNTYRRHFNQLRKFWARLPTAMCDETVVATNSTAYCWNGFKIVNNTESVQQRNVNGTDQNGQNDITITSLISQLKTMIKKMKAAVEGTTVIHSIIEEYSGSGQGSGSGSGDDGNYVDMDGEDKGNEDSTSINDILDAENETPEDNSVDKPMIRVASPALETRESGIGSASCLPISFLLLITSLFIQLI
ncbi:glypican-6-like [Dendronephthya gigantea]|uniref:glypican-6-like n=1 Tax=Dendronephthya gigantea TaxID=151771 RepID=UPI00106A10E4|nr:glypican-6-like [Dendronephthya gigantea]